MKARFIHQLLLLAWLAIFVQNAPAAVSLTVTPSAVSNTYNGNLTLVIAGLPGSGQTVVVQKFLDANTNGVIDAGDLMIQQFTVTDGNGGMIIGGVTNNNVPGDTDSVAQQITAKLNFQSDWLQTFAGNYLFKISSPSNTFTGLTNSFIVTNFNYAQKFSGTVFSNSTAVPNAIVVLFPTGRQYDNPVGGTVANNAGAYSLPAPAGSYTLVAVKTNFVCSSEKAPILTLTNGTTFNTNLSLIAATQTISGRVVDTNNTSLGVPGLFLAVQTRDRSTVGIAFTDTNGNFFVGVISNLWGISVDSASAALHGYVQFQNKVTAAISNNNVSGLSIGLPKATAFFYGTVKDGSGNPISGVVAMYANDQNNGLYESDGYTDTNGNFVTGVIGGLGTGDPWSLGVDNAGNFTNYVFSQPAFSQSGTNISTGQAVLANLTALTATNQISGNVKFNGTNLAGVQVYAYATIGTNSYYTEADTDTNGNYSFNVPGGSWTVDVYDCGCSDNDSLNNVISGGNYQAPASQNVVINGSGATVNFTVPYCGGVQITTTSPLPAAQQGNYYYTQLQATDCNDNFIWSLNDLADFPSGIGLSFDSSGEIYGEPSGYGTYNFSVNVSDGNGHSATQSLSLTISQGATPLQINTYGLSNAIQNASCYYTLSASGGQLPYTWSLLTGSANLPAGVSLSSSGIISGTPIGSGTDNFIVQVTDSASNNVYQPLSLTVSPSSLPQSIALKLLPPSGASLQFSFKAASGVTYTVQSSTNLKTWSKYETFTLSNSVPTSGTTWTVTIPNALATGGTYYRVKVGQ